MTGYNKRKFKYIGALAFFFLVLFIVSTIFNTIDFAIESKGNIYPHKEWLLMKNNNGSIISRVNDIRMGEVDKLQVIHPERGDVFSLDLDRFLKGTDKISLRDTIGIIHSFVLESRLAELETGLTEARKMRMIYASGEKESIIDLANKELEVSEETFLKTKKEYARKKELFAQNLLSEEELEQIKANYEIQKINIELKKTEIKTLLDGSKKELIDHWAAKIEAIKNEITIIKNLKEQYCILSPIPGKKISVVAADTLVHIGDFSRQVVRIPIMLADRKKISESKKVWLSSPFFEKTLTGKIVRVKPGVFYLERQPMIIVVAEISGLRDATFSGMECTCKIESKPVSLASYIYTLIQSVQVN